MLCNECTSGNQDRALTDDKTTMLCSFFLQTAAKRRVEERERVNTPKALPTGANLLTDTVPKAPSRPRLLTRDFSHGSREWLGLVGVIARRTVNQQSYAQRGSAWMW